MRLFMFMNVTLGLASFLVFSKNVSILSRGVLFPVTSSARSTSRSMSFTVSDALFPKAYGNIRYPASSSFEQLVANSRPKIQPRISSVLQYGVLW